MSIIIQKESNVIYSTHSFRNLAVMTARKVITKSALIAGIPGKTITLFFLEHILLFLTHVVYSYFIINLYYITWII